MDPSTRRCSIAVAGRDPRACTVSFDPDLRGGERLSHIRVGVVRLARHMLERGVPRLVLVEQPFAGGGKSKNRVAPASYYAVSAVMVGLYEALHRYGPVPVETIGVTSWKLASLGNGAADKAAIFRWAREHGYEGKLQDEADAWGIARAAELQLR